MARRLLTFLIGLTCLALVSAASATQLVVTGKMTVIGDNKDYRLVIERRDEHGTDHVLALDSRAGGDADCSIAGRGLAARLNKPAPAPIVGGRALAGGIPPGGKAEFRILTDKAFDGNGSPGEGAISEDCKSDATVVMGFGSPPKPLPKPAPTACNCTNLSVVGSKYSSAQVNTGKAQLKVNLNWTLKCSRRRRKTVRGTHRDQRARGFRHQGRLTREPKGHLQGSLYRPAVDVQGHDATAGLVDERPVLRQPRGKELAFRLRLYCTRGGKEVLVGAKRMTFAFGGGGFLDKKKSDLNGNRVPDGKDK